MPLLVPQVCRGQVGRCHGPSDGGAGRPGGAASRSPWTHWVYPLQGCSLCMLLNSPPRLVIMSVAVAHHAPEQAKLAHAYDMLRDCSSAEDQHSACSTRDGDRGLPTSSAVDAAAAQEAAARSAKLQQVSTGTANVLLWQELEFTGLSPHENVFVCAGLQGICACCSSKCCYLQCPGGRRTAH